MGLQSDTISICQWRFPNPLVNHQIPHYISCYLGGCSCLLIIVSWLNLSVISLSYPIKPPCSLTIFRQTHFRNSDMTLLPWLLFGCHCPSRVHHAKWALAIKPINHIQVISTIKHKPPYRERERGGGEKKTKNLTPPFLLVQPTFIFVGPPSLLFKPHGSHGWLRYRDLAFSFADGAMAAGCRGTPYLCHGSWIQVLFNEKYRMKNGDFCWDRHISWPGCVTNYQELEDGHLIKLAIWHGIMTSPFLNKPINSPIKEKDGGPVLFP